MFATLSSLLKPVEKLKEDIQLNETKDYADSSEFTEELHKIESKITELKAMIRQPRWMNWMQVTDHNFGTNTVSLNSEMHEKLVALDKAFSALEDELISPDAEKEDV